MVTVGRSPAQGAPPLDTRDASGETPQDDGAVPIHSPIVGTFYRTASPGAPPYVEVGDRVRRGQILCIVEAMKLMNEIESEVDGVVAEICVENARPVEYGEVLFRIAPG
jgi:acetyl-CoA carboxylase biotin carboxyl carrier protein